MRKYCKNILEILKKCEESEWCTIFENLLNQNIDDETFAKNVLKLYRGSGGSFNDLVLVKGNNHFPKENDELSELKDLLFNEAVSLL